MTESLPTRWERDLLVLRALVERFEDRHQPVSAYRLADDLKLEPAEVLSAFRNLARGNFILGARNEGTITDHVFDITERALRTTGVWPDEQQMADQLLWLLERKVEEAPNAEDRTRWVKIRDSIGGAGRDFAVELAAAMATRSLGG